MYVWVIGHPQIDLSILNSLYSTAEQEEACNLQVYLEDSPTQNGEAAGDLSGNWLEIARLLGRKHHIIESLHALSLVPEEASADYPRSKLIYDIIIYSLRHVHARYINSWHAHELGRANKLKTS